MIPLQCGGHLRKDNFWLMESLHPSTYRFPPMRQPTSWETRVVGVSNGRAFKWMPWTATWPTGQRSHAKEVDQRPSGRELVSPTFAGLPNGGAKVQVHVSKSTSLHKRKNNAQKQKKRTSPSEHLSIATIEARLSTRFGNGKGGKTNKRRTETYM